MFIATRNPTKSNAPEHQAGGHNLLDGWNPAWASGEVRLSHDAYWL
jgi:hypothetical protein